jgi:hypothetical protein
MFISGPREVPEASLPTRTEVDSGQRPAWWREVLYYAFVHPAGVVSAVIAAILASALIEAVLLWLGLGEALVDRFQGRFLGSPFYPLEVLFGFTIGFIANRRLRSRSAPFIWILAAQLLWSIIPYAVHNGMLREFIWGDGGLADTIDQLVTIAPLDAAVGYSVGAWLACRRQSQTRSREPGNKS